MPVAFVQFVRGKWHFLVGCVIFFMFGFYSLGFLSSS